MRHPALAVGILVSRYVVVIALAVLVTARPSAVSPSTRYRIIDLGAVAADRYSVAHDVNDRGQIVGRRSPCELDRPCSSTAVLFEKGTMIDLVTPAGYETAAISASDINSRGQSVGCMYAFRSDQLRPLLWEHGIATQLGVLTDALAGCAAGINERGQIVGWNFVQSTNAVLWQDGTITDLGALPGDDLSIATAINNREQIVGYSLGGVTWHAVLWDHGTITDLGTLTGPAGGGGLSQAWDINDRGQVVGGCSDEVQLGHGFLWEDGTMTDLGTLIGPAGSSGAAGINNRGQIVGYSDSVAGPTHAVLWEQGAITDLGTLIGPAGSSGAAGINNRGQIVGYSDSAAGPTHAVLWERGSAH